MNSLLHTILATLFVLAGLGAGFGTLPVSPAYAVDAEAAALNAVSSAAGGPLPASVPAAPASAPHRDLVFGLGNANEPFYKDGIFMIGDRLVAIEPGTLPADKLVAYDEKAARITVSDDKSVSETDKGAALLSLMDALSVEDIAPAAGR